MKAPIAAILFSLLSAGPALAQHSAEETRQDIQRHRAMAAAHEAAAKCLLHWTKACDEAIGVTPAGERKAILPNGEGLPLPWPFPWQKVIEAAEI